MARTWFAGLPTAQMDPPSKDPNVAVPTKGDLAQLKESVSSKNEVAVNDFATAHHMTPTKTAHCDSESNRPATWVTSISSPQKELDTQQTKEAVDASTELARLIQQYSKPAKPQTPATSKDPTASQPVEMVHMCAPSSTIPRRAPTAQMVPLTPNAAITKTAAATTTPETPTVSLFGLYRNPSSIFYPPASFPTTALPSLPAPSIVPSSRIASPKGIMPRKHKSKIPKISLTPVPATAPSAFKDAALAAHIQNTRLLSPVKHQTNGIKKRQYEKAPSSKRVLTPKCVPEDKRGRSPRSEEQPPQEYRQYQPFVQLNTPCARTGSSNQSNLSISSPFAFPLQQQQAVISSDQFNQSRLTPSAFPFQQQQTATLNFKDDLNLRFCSEEPRLWHGCGDYIASLVRFDSEPVTAHSEPIQACANHAAHQDPHKPYGHGVCATCHYAARRHLRATRPELFRLALWPLCKACGDNEVQHAQSDRKGCSCEKTWLCFSCKTLELERRTVRNSVEAEFRRTFVGEYVNEDVKIVLMGWNCECGKQIGPNPMLVRCVGCRGVLVGRVSRLGEIARENALIKAALAWT